MTITAGSGTGKSTLCGEIAVKLIKQDQTVGYIALEESVKRTGLRLMTVSANKPLHLNNEIPSDALKGSFRDTLGSGHVYLRDGFGSVDPDSLLNDIRYLVKTNEVKWIILDHFRSSSVWQREQRRAQDDRRRYDQAPQLSWRRLGLV